MVRDKVFGTGKMLAVTAFILCAVPSLCAKAEVKEHDVRELVESDAISYQELVPSGGDGIQNNGSVSADGGGADDSGQTGSQTGTYTEAGEHNVTIGNGVKAGDIIGGRAPDGSYGDKILVTSVDYSTSTGTATYLWYRSATNKLIIEDEYIYYGLTLKITEIADGACKDNKNVTSITIGKNVQRIGKKAFYGAKKCKTLTIKSTKLTTKKVGKNAFGSMYKKVKVRLPKKKYKAYKKWIYKKGISKKAKLKKL